MKKVWLLISSFVMCSAVVAQIHMESTGAVGVGSNYAGPFAGGNNSRFFIDGNWANLPQGAAKYWIVDKVGAANDPCIYSSNDWGVLGKPDQQLWCIYVNSIMLSGELFQNSDERLKTNIRTLGGSNLSKIKNIRGVKYDFKPELFDSIQGAKKDKQVKNMSNKMGFLAQEILKEYPELVEKSEETGMFRVNYIGMIPVLLESIKEQQLIVENLQKEILELKNNSGGDSKLKSASITTNTNSISESPVNTGNSLYQNLPNPFTQSTTIEYTIDENVQNAMICIYDMNGAQLKCIPLQITRSGNISINGNELKPGMYLYSLLADGQLIDTKRMVLTN